VARSPRFPRGKRTPLAEAGQRSPSAVPCLARSARPPRSESHLHLGHGWMCLQPPSPPGAVVHLPQSRSLLTGEVTKISWCRRLRVHDRRRNKQTKRSHTTPRPLLALLWQGISCYYIFAAGPPASHLGAATPPAPHLGTAAPPPSLLHSCRSLRLPVGSTATIPSEVSICSCASNSAVSTSAHISAITPFSKNHSLFLFPGYSWPRWYKALSSAAFWPKK